MQYYLHPKRFQSGGRYSIRFIFQLLMYFVFVFQLTNADIVVFHAPTHGQVSPAIPTRHPANLIYAMISLEQPNYAKVLSRISYLESHFDLLATYSREYQYPGSNVANLPISYFPLNIVSINSMIQASKPFAKKTGYGTGKLVVGKLFDISIRLYLFAVIMFLLLVVLIHFFVTKCSDLFVNKYVAVAVSVGVTVAVFTSNCKAAGASGRFKYLEELLKLINVSYFRPQQ